MSRDLHIHLKPSQASSLSADVCLWSVISADAKLGFAYEAGTQLRNDRHT
jgi:hypothetical protein